MTGRLLGGRYWVEAVVQQTEQSVVYRAVHRLWRRPVAIKAFRAPPLGDAARQQLLEAFVREGALLAELSECTAAVCQSRDVASLVTERGDWVPYMVLEWLDGEPLDDVLYRERAQGAPPRTVERAIQVLGPVAHALSLAHDRGIVHRDVKPGNICLLASAPAGTPSTKLYDFGIAVSPRDHESSAAGGEPVVTSFTPGYAAPEQYSVELGAVGPWTDVFSLALVFLELITGQDALVGETLQDLQRRACDPLDRPTPHGRGVYAGEGVERVLAKALAPRPEDRYPHAGDFWTALARAAKERFNEATIPIQLVRRRGPPRGRWVVPALFAGCGAALLAALAHWADLVQALGQAHLP
ncbi:MAG: serine/threonine-protein kinase [Polyangiaceae bacterium]